MRGRGVCSRLLRAVSRCSARPYMRSETSFLATHGNGEPNGQAEGCISPFVSNSVTLLLPSGRSDRGAQPGSDATVLPTPVSGGRPSQGCAGKLSPNSRNNNTWTHPGGLVDTGSKTAPRDTPARAGPRDVHQKHSMAGLLQEPMRPHRRQNRYVADSGSSSAVVRI